jgi:hypothetical protein
MTAEEIASAIQGTSFFTGFRESSLPYPIVLSTHLTTIGIFGGLILLTNLRLLGWVLPNVAPSDIIRGTRPWKWLGFIIQITCGILLGGAKLLNYYNNPYFIIKIALLFVILAHGLYFRRSVYRNPELDGMKIMPRQAKVAGALAIILWVGVVSMGRWIAYWEPKDESKETAAVVLQDR